MPSTGNGEWQGSARHSKEELQRMWEEAARTAREKVQDQQVQLKANLENLRAEVQIADRAWTERLQFLAEMRKRVALLLEPLKAKGEKVTRDTVKALKTTDKQLQDFSFEVEVRGAIIYDACQKDLQIFCDWMELLLSRIGMGEEDAERVFGYCVQALADEKRLGVARLADRTEEARILDALGAGERPETKFIIYNGRTRVPVNSDDPLHRRVFYYLESLRREAKRAYEVRRRAGNGHRPPEENNKDEEG